jgi:hypothetical protein
MTALIAALRGAPACEQCVRVHRHHEQAHPLMCAACAASCVRAVADALLGPEAMPPVADAVWRKYQDVTATINHDLPRAALDALRERAGLDKEPTP